MLAEEAGDMLARRGEAVVDGRGDQHLDDRRLRPAILFRVEKGAVHIVERRREDDPRLVMLARFGEAGELRQLRQRDIHTEGAAARLERSEEHTSELQSLMRISYAVFCLKKKNNQE